eukprot:9290536-Alexandrium_andersonii.AAC.1
MCIRDSRCTSWRFATVGGRPLRGRAPHLPVRVRMRRRVRALAGSSGGQGRADRLPLRHC